MLVDSSVWVDFLRGASAPEVVLLRTSLERGDAIWLAPPVLQEVLQGADSPQRFDRWDRALGELPILEEPDMRGLVRQASRLYAQCRWHAFTPRSANDCLIAAYSIRFSMPLLHRDRDFENIARVEGRLQLLKVS